MTSLHFLFPLVFFFFCALRFSFSIKNPQTHINTQSTSNLFYNKLFVYITSHLVNDEIWKKLESKLKNQN